MKNVTISLSPERSEKLNKQSKRPLRHRHSRHLLPAGTSSLNRVSFPHQAIAISLLNAVQSTTHTPSFSFTFTVLGTPAPQGSKRHVGKGVMVESSRGCKPWRQDVRHTAMDFFLMTGMPIWIKRSRFPASLFSLGPRIISGPTDS